MFYRKKLLAPYLQILPEIVLIQSLYYSDMTLNGQPERTVTGQKLLPTDFKGVG